MSKLRMIATDVRGNDFDSGEHDLDQEGKEKLSGFFALPKILRENLGQEIKFPVGRVEMNLEDDLGAIISVVVVYPVMVMVNEGMVKQ